MAQKIPIYGELDCRTAENILADSEQIKYNNTNVKEELASKMKEPSNIGTVGQVLKKTETGSEWQNESGGGGVQSDYNQNDSTAPDYIKNRPFYEEMIEEILLEQTFSTTTVNEMNLWDTQDKIIQLTEGDTVKVVFKGIEYSQTVKPFIFQPGTLYVGNLAVADSSLENTGEPFLVMNMSLTTSNNGTSVITEQAQTNATIKISKNGKVIHQMNSEYIKNMYFDKEPKRITIISGYTIPSMTLTGDKYFCSWHNTDANLGYHYEYIECYNAIITIDNNSFSAPFAFIDSESASKEYLSIVTPTFRLNITPNGHDFYLRTTENLSNKSLTVEIVKTITNKIAPRFTDLNVLTIDTGDGSSKTSGLENYINNNEGMVAKILNADVLRIYYNEGVAVFLYTGVDSYIDADVQTGKTRYIVFFSQVLTKRDILTIEYITITIEDGACTLVTNFSNTINVRALTNDIIVTNFSGSLSSIDSLLDSHSRIALNTSGGEYYVFNEFYRNFNERVFICPYSKEEGISGYNLVLTRVSAGKDEYNYNITKVNKATT